MRYNSRRAFCNDAKYVIVYGSKIVKCRGCNKELETMESVYYCHPNCWVDDQGNETRYIHCEKCMRGDAYCPTTDHIHSDEPGRLHKVDTYEQALALEMEYNKKNNKEDKCTEPVQ